MPSRRRARRLAPASFLALSLAAPVGVWGAAPSSAEEPSFVSRMTGRYTPYTDAAGVRWEARSGSLGTDKASSLLAGKEVSGTDLDGRYQVNAFGVSGYRLTVPHVGRYRVRLLMAEDWYTRAGQRVFDVRAEGQDALTGVDIAGAVGKAAAYDREFTLPVRDGRLDLEFVRRVDLPLVSAIEVTYAGPEDAPEKAVFVSRQSAAPRAVKDAEGRSWEARGTGWGSWKTSTGMAGRDVAGTEDDELFRVIAWDMGWYTLPVPGPGTYRVRLRLLDDWDYVGGRRVFDVRAEGATVRAGIDVAGTVGFGTAMDVSFPVNVTDGELTLEFPASVGAAMVAAVEVISDAPQPVPPAGHERAIALAPGSVWTADVRSAPVAGNSAQVVANLARTVNDRYGGVAALNTYRFNTSFARVAPGAPRTTVGYVNCQGKDGVPPGLYDGAKHFVDVPVPDDAVPAQGSDGELTVYDPAADQAWQFWQMRRNPQTHGWEACWGGRLDGVSGSQGAFPQWYGASASGLLSAAGMVTMEDVRRGEINHLMALGVVESQASVWSWPAQRTDGTSADPNVVMHGQRLRLDPSVDVDALGLTPVGRIVAKAAQTHGFIVVDTSGAVGLATEAGDTIAARTGVNPWGRLLGGPDYLALKGFPWERLQVLPKDFGAPAAS